MTVIVNIIILLGLGRFSRPFSCPGGQALDMHTDKHWASSGTLTIDILYSLTQQKL